MEARLLNKINKTSSCWEWIGAIGRDGYGGIGIAGKRKAAHRVVYEFYKEPIPEGLEIDHLCFNTKCVNPDHLEPVTHKENCRRAIAHYGSPSKKKEFCKRGHKFTQYAKRQRCLICQNKIAKGKP